MTKRLARTRAALLVPLFAFAAVLLVTSVVYACGGFFSRKVLGARKPSLAYEKTLIVFDEEKRREHFVREVVFRAATEAFGFVVPAPSRPEVGSLKSPFETLESHVPFDTLALGSVGTRAGGGAATRSKSAVQVLEVKQVGSFKSFVLAASDPKALAEWLSANGFSTAPESDRWLAHYVRLQFFYVAMRYDPPAGTRPDAERTLAETVRISFDTPLPYYPYYEPDHPPGAAPEGPRMLEVWFVSQSHRVPVAARSDGGQVTWVRPMAAGRRFSTNSETKLQAGFGAAFELLPKGPVSISRFIDQKRSRSGYGDVLFVPATASAPNLDGMRRLYPILDPSLSPEVAAP